MFGKLGRPELVIIVVLAILIFGPKAIGSLGRSIREFRHEMREP